MQPTRPIEVLPQPVIEKIAAGEVVERPAAVIKELVENSIDAGADKISIIVEEAGFSFIKIVDNGTGMSPDNLRKCMLRHATSKIRQADDLFAIGTFGFRGEALGSIGAISRMSIISSDSSNGEGYGLDCIGGEIADEVVPAPHRRGTTVIVGDLFFNVPARKKFMKTARGEHLAIIRMLEQLVIPFPSIHFTLRMDDKTIFDLPGVEHCVDRIAGVAGPDYARSLIECRGEREHMDVVVYVSSPDHLQERPRFQSLYVNLRRINNDSVMFSVKEAFSRFLGHNQRPAFFCFLTIDPSRIDVNVHPTKQLIKFDNDREIFSFVFNCVKESIGSVMSAGTSLRSPQELLDAREIESLVEPVPTTEKTDSMQQSLPLQEVREVGDGWNSGISSQPSRSGQTILSFPGGARVEKVVDQAKESTVQLVGDDQETPWSLISCYQIHAMFILAPIKNGILLIDQHAAHERILFEQALENCMGNRTTSQQLLFPIVLELGVAEKAIAESGLEHFRQFGFEIGDFGGQSVSVSAIPAFVRDGMVESTVREMLAYLLEGRNPAEFTEPHKRFAAAFACGAAIKAGQKLTQEEMNGLLNNLFATRNPYTCPHGRPTLVRMSTDELSRRFLR